MLTSTPNTTGQVSAVAVHFVGNVLCITLSDGREVSVPTERVDWLARATPEQRAKWSIEPGGFAVDWDELDDGVEICHLLGMQPVQ